MKKVTIKICSGTACFVMGGAHMLMLKDELPEALKERVTVEGSFCLEYCKNEENGKPPFVLVDDVLISEANATKVIEYVEGILTEGA